MKVTPAKLFIGCLASADAFKSAAYSDLVRRLEKEVGPLREIWPSETGWIAPHSYAVELGEALTTQIFVFNGQWQPKKLATVKLRTLEIEDWFKEGDSRRFNLNPGIVDSVSMRLASHKPSHRRRQISENVWVEDQMYWSRGELVPMSHVFQEYVMGSRLSLIRRLAYEVVPRESGCRVKDTMRHCVFHPGEIPHYSLGG